MADYNKIYSFLKDYNEFLSEAEKKEQEKMNAMLSNDVKYVEKVIAEYQFTVKKMQDFEQKRIELFIMEDIEDVNFKTVIESFEGDERKNLKKLYDEFVLHVKNIKDFNSRSLEIANLNLKIMDELNMNNDNISDPNCYNQNGIQNGTSRRNSLFNTKI